VNSVNFKPCVVNGTFVSTLFSHKYDKFRLTLLSRNIIPFVAINGNCTRSRSPSRALWYACKDFVATVIPFYKRTTYYRKSGVENWSSSIRFTVRSPLSMERRLSKFPYKLSETCQHDPQCPDSWRQHIEKCWKLVASMFLQDKSQQHQNIIKDTTSVVKNGGAITPLLHTSSWHSV
jgi:hypothetical protein